MEITSLKSIWPPSQLHAGYTARLRPQCAPHIAELGDQVVIGSAFCRAVFALSVGSHCPGGRGLGQLFLVGAMPRHSLVVPAEGPGCSGRFCSQLPHIGAHLSAWAWRGKKPPHGVAVPCRSSSPTKHDTRPYNQTLGSQLHVLSELFYTVLGWLVLVPHCAEATSLVTSALQGVSAAFVPGWVTRCGVCVLMAGAWASQGRVFSASWHLNKLQPPADAGGRSPGKFWPGGPK